MPESVIRRDINTVSRGCIRAIEMMARAAEEANARYNEMLSSKERAFGEM